MVKILIGCNVKLKKGEAWAGRILDQEDGTREARMEPGDQVERLPELAAVDWLVMRGAIEIVPDEPKARTDKARREESTPLPLSSVSGGSDG